MSSSLPQRSTAHVWIADLSRAPEGIGALLTGEEIARADAVRDARARARWIASRGLLRALLGEWVGVDPRSLSFEVGPYGKPRLKLAAPAFNVSHSGHLALCAICQDREVGVDVEVSDRRGGRRDDIAVARRILGEAVANELSALHGERRAAAFLKAWVAHEAVVKCLGTGIGHAGEVAGHGAGAGDGVGVGVGAGAGGCGGAGEVTPRPWVRELDVGDGAHAALAVAGGPAQITLRRAWGQG